MSCEQLLSVLLTSKTRCMHQAKLNLFDKQFTIVATTTSDTTNGNYSFP
jgi:hypothetical protein